ncbi:MAG: hypothetical protein WCG25_01965 [bacterium]
MLLYEYKKYLTFENYTNQRKKYKISNKYITIFPSSYERSINIEKWSEVIKYINEKNIQVIIL